MHQKMRSTRLTAGHLITLAVLLVSSFSRTAAAQSYTIAPTPYQTFFDNSGRIISNGCIWTYTAGTTTAVTTYSDNVGTPNLNPIRSDANGRFVAFLVPGQSYKFVYESNSCSPPSTHGTVIKTVDGINAQPASAATVDVPIVAGESLTTGQVAYMSNGDGGKTQGLWYKADSTNGYSSTTYSVGLVVANVAQNASGTARIQGEFTGLSALSTGSKYYVGTAGALTSTVPASNARFVGQSDSSTSMVVSAVLPAPIVPFVDDFRLSFTTATCVTTSDVTGASAVTVFLTPCTGNRITLFDTTGVAETCASAEVSIAVPATTATMYDVWAYDSTFGTCTVTLEVLAWTNDTTRATATARTNGRWVKSGNSSRLYVGSFRTAGSSGQSEDSTTKRYLYNQYNRVSRTLTRADSTASYGYTTATIRQANGSTSNQVEVVVGQAEVGVDLVFGTTVGDSGAGLLPVSIGIGFDSTTTYLSPMSGGTGTSGASTGAAQVNLTAHVTHYPTIGKHVYSMNEKGSGGGGTTTWYGTGTYTGGETMTGQVVQ